MSFIVAAGIAAGGAIAGGLISSSAAKSAAKTQAQAAADSTQVQKDIFDKQVELNAPFRDVGLSANNRLAYLLGLTPGGTSVSPAAGPTPSFGGLSPQMLTQGPDGVFQAPAQGQSIAPATPIPAGQAGTALTQLGLSDRFNVSPDGQSFVSRTTGQSIPLSYFTSGQYQHEAQSGNFGPYQSSITPPPPAQAPAAAPLPPANDMTGFGSLAQSFNAGDYAADGAPKIAPFTQAVPQAQQFAQYGGSQQIGQYGGAQQIGAFKGTPQVGNYQGAQNLDGFTDMPDFKPDMMQEDPGYQFRLDQGMKGVNNSAAARGGLLSGAAVKAAADYNQNFASNEYGNAFNRYQTTRGNKLQDFLTNRDTSQLNNQNALTTYTTNRQTAQQNADNSLRDYATNRDSTQLNNTNNLATYNTNANTTNTNNANNRQDYATNLATQQQNYANQNTAYNNNLNQYSLNRNNALQDYESAYQRFQQNRGNVINPLLSMMGYGQQATGATSNAAQNFGNQSAAAIQAAGNATAAGQVGSANALNGAFTGAAGSYQNNQLMNLLLSRQSGGAGVAPPANPFYTGSTFTPTGSAFSGFE